MTGRTLSREARYAVRLFFLPLVLLWRAAGRYVDWIEREVRR